MKKSIKIYLSILMLLMACETDIPNPNAATEEDVLNSAEGLTLLVNGIRSRYTLGGAGGLYSYISANGLSTNELQVLNAGNVNVAALSLGEDNVTPSNSIVTNLWNNLNLIKTDAEALIDNAGKITEAGTAAGIQAYGHLYKALALGTMAQFWEQAPISTADDAEFSSRQQALEEAVSLLDQAITLISSTPVSADFLADVGTAIDLSNTLNALSARYNLMLGNFDNAIARANAVDLTVPSIWTFDNVSPNPVFRTSLTTNNVYDVNPDFGLNDEFEPDTLDGRIAFYLESNEENGKGFFLSDETPIPLYLPGEMLLIKAEAYARKGDVNKAIEELNKVLTKTDDIYGVNANLPPYSGPETQEAVLTEIFRNRAIELYMSGLKLEDSRRFDRPGPNDADSERNRNFYPFPNTERDNNPNTPPDPPV